MLRFALVGICFCTLHAQDPAARWREDLKVFESEFSGHQKDFDKLYPAFHGEVAGLRSEIGKLTDAEIALRLMKIVASANIGHNMMFPIAQLRPLPVTLAWYSDGLAVVSATPDYAQALGTHVVRIGSMTPDQLRAAVAPYIGHENDNWLKARSTGMMKMLSLLQAGRRGRFWRQRAVHAGQTWRRSFHDGDCKGRDSRKAGKYVRRAAHSGRALPEETGQLLLV